MTFWIKNIVQSFGSTDTDWDMLDETGEYTVWENP